MKLSEQLCRALRMKHYSLSTEESYLGWYRRFVRWHGLRHPAELREPEVEAFLSYLANERKVSASTQNQAFSALLFLYSEVLSAPLGRVSAYDADLWRTGETANVALATLAVRLGVRLWNQPPP